MNIDHILRGLTRFEVDDQLDRNLLNAAADLLRKQAARVAVLQADYKSLEIMARKWRECSRRWQEAAEAKSGEG